MIGLVGGKHIYHGNYGQGGGQTTCFLIFLGGTKKQRSITAYYERVKVVSRTPVTEFGGAAFTVSSITSQLTVSYTILSHSLSNQDD